MSIVGRLDQYASMLAVEFDETTANNPSITGLGTYYASQFSENIDPPLVVIVSESVLNLDAGNINSYPGSGTTWFDISGNNKNATLVGDQISYLNINGGVFDFNGVGGTDSDYFSLPNTSFTLGANFTIEVWNYYDSASQPSINPWTGGCLYTNSAESDWSIGAGNNNGLLFGYNSIVYRNTSAVETKVDYSTAPTTRVWHQHVLVVNSGVGRVYVDKVQVATLSNMRTYTQSNGTLGIGIADKLGSNYRGEYNGYIPNVKVYTKALTLSEIQQNYDSLAGRYGLSSIQTSANVFAPYDPVYDEFAGVLYGPGQGTFMRQNTDKTVIVYNEIDEVTDFYDRGNIVKDGLVLDLDASDLKSYPESGTTWYDLSGRGNNATLINGPTFSSADGGSILFDGTNDYMSVNISCSRTFYSIDWWTRPTAVSNFDQVIMMNSTGTAGSYWNGFTIHTDGSGRVYIGTTTGSRFLTSNNTLQNNVWHNFVWTFNNGTATLYKNGTQVQTGAISLHSADFTLLQIGAGPGFGENTLFDGRCPSLKLYSNKVLTTEEVQRNYNALRNRFGL